MKNIIYNNITEFCEEAGMPAPENPFFYIMHSVKDPEDTEVRACGKGGGVSE